MSSNPLQRLIDQRLAGSQGQLPNDPEAQEKLPVLWSFLTRMDMNGEYSKDPASVTIRKGLGNWIVELFDPTLEVSFSMAIPTLKDALERLEEGINDPAASFRPFKGSQGKFVKKNKRSVDGVAESK